MLRAIARAVPGLILIAIGIALCAGRHVGFLGFSFDGPPIAGYPFIALGVLIVGLGIHYAKVSGRGNTAIRRSKTAGKAAGFLVKDALYLEFYDTFLMKCPYCDQGRVWPQRMRREGRRILGMDPEVCRCPHLLIYGAHGLRSRFVVEGFEDFRRLQNSINNPSREAPEAVQLITPKSFAFFCADVPRLREWMRTNPSPADRLSVTCPICARVFPIPLWRDREEDFGRGRLDLCPHVAHFREFRSGCDGPAWDMDLDGQNLGNSRLTAYDVLFGALCRGDIPHEIRPVVRSVWDFDPETGGPVADDEDGIYHVFVFSESPEKTRALCKFARHEASRLRSSAAAAGIVPAGS